jgi:hypothetical protein
MTMDSVWAWCFVATAVGLGVLSYEIECLKAEIKRLKAEVRRGQ